MPTQEQQKQQKRDRTIYLCVWAWWYSDIRHIAGKRIRTLLGANWWRDLDLRERRAWLTVSGRGRGVAAEDQAAAEAEAEVWTGLLPPPLPPRYHRSAGIFGGSGSSSNTPPQRPRRRQARGESKSERRSFQKKNVQPQRTGECATQENINIVLLT